MVRTQRRRNGKRFLVVFLAGIIGLAAVVLARTATSPSRQVAVVPCAPVAVDGNRAAARLGRAIQFRTISYEDPARFDEGEFDAFRAFLVAAYPAVHAALNREIVGGHSMLYTWPGSDPSLAPLLFLAHYDVVPVEEGTESAWEHPAFSGAIADGFVWGRGTLDFKCGVTGLLEAAEALLAENFRPARTIYFAFGHDEELSGRAGAAQIAALLKERGVKALFSLDEGMVIAEGMVPGVSRPVALIGVAEKGYVSLELKAESSGGHSSSPPPETAIGMLAGAVARLEAHPMPPRFEGPTCMMLEYLGPEMDFPLRLAIANLWLFKGIVSRFLSASPAGDASIRTTTAPTIFEAGTKDNVLPVGARAVVNFRIVPGDTIDAVVEHTRRVIDDPKIAITVLSPEEAANPSPVSAVDAPGFHLLAASFREVRPDVVVAPCLVIGASDSKHYCHVAQNLYRIQPEVFGEADVARIHGINERLSIEDYVRGIQTYAQIIRKAASAAAFQ